MAKLPRPFVITRRTDSNSFRLTINFTSGLPERVCAEWYRRSFQDLPEELAQYRNPKTKSGKLDSSAADAVHRRMAVSKSIPIGIGRRPYAGATALIVWLKKKQSEGGAMRVRAEDITVGKWIEKFTAIETSPRTGVNASKNRPSSLNTLDAYQSYFNCHIKDDPICRLKMAEVEERDILDYMTRLSVSLHSTEKTIRDIGMKITEAREKGLTMLTAKKEEPRNIVKFKAS